MATPSAPEAIPANSTSTEVNNNSTAKVPSPQEASDGLEVLADNTSGEAGSSQQAVGGEGVLSDNASRECIRPEQEAEEDDTMTAEELEAFELAKVRHERRLRHRWKCKRSNHTYCYVDTILGIHVQLSDPEIDTWVATIQNGYATLLRPPDSIAGSNPNSSTTLKNSDTSSVHSKNSISYQRSFSGLQGKIDLSDLRSWRNNLEAKSDARTVSSKSKSSGASSSIIPGPGYYAGSIALWLGRKMLSFIIVFDSRRRIWKAGRLTNRMKKVPGDSLETWLVKNQKAVNQLLNDLLELTSDDYSAGIQKASSTQGSRFQEFLIQVEYHHRVEYEPEYWLLSSKASPFAFFGHGEGGNDKGLGVKMREVLLLEQTSMEELKHLLGELAGCACDELLYGISPASRTLAWKLLFDIHQLSFGATELKGLARPTGCLPDLAQRMLDGKLTDNEERFRAVQFFGLFADNFPSFQHYVTDSAEMLIDIFKSASQVESPDWGPLSYKCGALGFVSHYPWGNASLLDRNICDLLVYALLVHQKAGYPEPWSDYNVMWVFHNVFERGGERGRQAVCQALTPEVRALFQYLVKPDVPWATEDIGNHVRKWGAQMLDAVKEEETKTGVAKTEVAEKND